MKLMGSRTKIRVAGRNELMRELLKDREKAPKVPVLKRLLRWVRV